MKSWLFIALPLVIAGGCSKSSGGSSKKAVEKPLGLLAGQGRQRIRNLELRCKIEIEPGTNRVWATVDLVNHGEQAAFVPSPTESIWTADQGGRAFYVVGAPAGWDIQPTRPPIYAPMGPNETRTWTLEGDVAPTPIENGTHHFNCALSIGPDGNHFLQAGGRAASGLSVPM